MQWDRISYVTLLAGKATSQEMRRSVTFLAETLNVSGSNGLQRTQRARVTRSLAEVDDTNSTRGSWTGILTVKTSF